MKDNTFDDGCRFHSGPAELSVEGGTTKFVLCRTCGATGPYGRNPGEAALKWYESRNNEIPKRTRGAKGASTWEAYSKAYSMRYGLEPHHNAKTMALCVQLVDLLGAETAPEVARYYPTIQDQPYKRDGHPLTLLVRDAQKLCTEWETGRRITQVPTLNWLDCQKERDQNGNLTKLAIALDALVGNGCDCSEGEPGSCMACLCEAALKEQWEEILRLRGKIEKYDVEWDLEEAKCEEESV